MFVRWRFAHSSKSFLVTIRGSPGKMGLSVSRQSGIGASINKYPLVCVTCYPLFRHGYIALCPPNEILEYLVRYVRETPAEDQMPLYKVCIIPSHVPSLHQVGNRYSLNWPPPIHNSKVFPTHRLSCRMLGCTVSYT
jgi:hypothetical protein